MIDKLERQVRKYKTKINRKSREKGFDIPVAPVVPETVDEDESVLEIVRTKRVDLKTNG